MIKSWLLNKTWFDNLLAKLTNKKRENSNNRSQKKGGDITTWFNRNK